MAIAIDLEGESGIMKLTTFSRWYHWFFQLRWLVTNGLIAWQQQIRLQFLAEPRYGEPNRLNRHEYQVFSQNGEDGLIAEIFHRIGTTNRTFLEIGVEDGLESNTTFLLMQGWRGYWIEGRAKSVSFIRGHFSQVLQEDRLKVCHAFVDAENVSPLLETFGVPEAVDFLSLDIDRNTYYVLEAILQKFSPRLLAIEYNALIPPHLDWKVEYAPKKSWNRSSYYGASLKALELLGREHGYCLVGCDLCGVNAFFVRADLCSGDDFAAPFTAENHYEPPRDYLVHRVGPPRRFTDMD